MAPTNPNFFMLIVVVQIGKSVWFAQAKSSDWRTFMHSFNKKQLYTELFCHAGISSLSSGQRSIGLRA